MIGRLFKFFRFYQSGKMLYSKVLKPVYEELRKDAYASEPDKYTRNKKRKTVKKNVVNQKPKRSDRPKANP